ncbi:MAG: YfhO family protein [Acidobacteriota bacterium]
MQNTQSLLPSFARRLVPVAALLLLPFCFYWKLFAWDPGERKIFRGDFLNQHYVWKSYAFTRIKQGELPLWNPHVLGGVAFHANPQVGLFYPPNYLLLLFHSEGKVNYLALEAFQLLHQGLAGLGIWLLLRSLGVGRLAAWLGALSAMFTGFFTTPGHQALVLTAAWIPLNLYLVKKAVESQALRHVAVSSVGLAMMLLAGHPQPAYYGVLLTTVWALYSGGWRGALYRYLPALVLAVALASIQLIPTYQLAQESSRVATGYDYSTTFGFSPFLLAGAIVPQGQVRLPGQDSSAPLHIYAGVANVFLAAVGVFVSRRRERWLFAGIAAVSLLLAFGEHSILFDLAYLVVPGFSRFRIPFRMLGLYTLAMAILAAFGMEALLSLRRHARRRLVSVVKAAFGLTLILAAWSAYVQARLVTAPGSLEPREVERLVSGANWALVMAILACLLLLAHLWRGRDRWPAWALLALVVVDLGSFVKDRGQHPYRTLVRAGERPVTRFLRAQGHRSRYVTDSNLESYAMLHGTEFAGGQDSLVDRRYAELLALGQTSANALSLLNVKFVVRATPLSKIPWCGPRFASPLPLLDITPEMSPVTLKLKPPIEAGHVRLSWSGLGPASRATVELNGRGFPLPSEGPLEVSFEPREKLGTITVRLAEGSSGIRLEEMELDLSPLGLKADFIHLGGILLNLHYLPRAYFATSSSASAKNDDQQEPTSSLDCWTPYDDVVITDPETGEHTRGTFRKDLARIVRYEPETVELEVDTLRAGYVILADTFRPGWQAEVDGKAAPVLRAQHALRAVAVAEGRHRIRFAYRPPSFYTGMVLSLLATGAILGSLLFHRLRPVASLDDHSSKQDPPRE